MLVFSGEIGALQHHKYNMMAQMGIKTTAGLIQYAVKRGVVD